MNRLMPWRLRAVGQLHGGEAGDFQVSVGSRSAHGSLATEDR